MVTVLREEILRQYISSPNQQVHQLSPETNRRQQDLVKKIFALQRSYQTTSKPKKGFNPRRMQLLADYF